MIKLDKNTRNGITLIALIITIIVLLILAGVSISALVGDNGVLTQATKAKEKTDISSIKEETEMELLSIDFDEKGQNRNLTVSEKVDKLKETGILNDDMTFKQNSNYKLSYCGNIVNNNQIVERIKLCSNINSIDALPHPSVTGRINGNIKIGCADGIVNLREDVAPGEENTVITLKPNDAPNGYKFAYWVNESNDIFSYEREQTFHLICDQIFVPIYIKNDITVNKQPCVTTYVTNNTKDAGAFVDGLIFLTCAYGVDNVEGGLLSFDRRTILTTESNYANEENMNFETIDNRPVFYVAQANVSGTDSFEWTFSKTNAGDATWYFRGRNKNYKG